MAEPVNPGKSVYETGAAYRARMAAEAEQVQAHAAVVAEPAVVEPALPAPTPPKAVRKGKVATKPRIVAKPKKK